MRLPPPEWLPAEYLQAWRALDDEIDFERPERVTQYEARVTQRRNLAFWRRIGEVARELGEFTVNELAEAAHVSRESARCYCASYAYPVGKRHWQTANGSYTSTIFRVKEGT